MSEIRQKETEIPDIQETRRKKPSAGKKRKKRAKQSRKKAATPVTDKKKKKLGPLAKLLIKITVLTIIVVIVLTWILGLHRMTGNNMFPFVKDGDLCIAYACGKWKAEENIDYSVYGTPLESTTYKFAKCLQKRFGKIPGVTDKNYITNSYHIRVTENINAFDKLTKEAEFQKLSPGGAISYVEVPNMQGNIPAVLAIIKHIYNTILYAELNTKSDQCEACGYNGEIQIVNKDSKLIWRCPQCGCTDQNKMHVARRTCGYIGTQYWNQGRTQEIAERVLHVSVDEDETEKNQ